MKEIILKQNAVIQHDLLNVGKMVDERLKELNIENLVATDDTIKAMKSLRADLNAEFKDFEEQRKTIKNLVAKPYMTLEEVYKEQVSEKYNGAISTLKSKIDEHEIKIKKEKQDVLEEYFEECKDLTDTAYIKFSDLGITVNLSTSIKNYREQIDAFFAKIVDDLNLIETQEHEAEILVEYKKDLNCSRAIKEVMERKAKEKLEKERQAEYETRRRQKELANHNFKLSEFEGVYVHSTYSDLYISLSDVETRSNIEFDAILESIRSEVSKRGRETIKAPVKIDAPTSSHGAPAADEVPTQKPKLLTARFEVSGTLEQLQALGNYLKQNNLTYNNI